MYKKVYIEITNICNLNCPFCIKNGRSAKYMSMEEFKTILAKLKNHTKYLYFHVLGEPLMHPNINEMIEYAHNNFYINITSNGYLIEKIKHNKNIRQLNISLHSYNKDSNKSLKEYMNNIFNAVDELKKTTYISFRLWANTPFKQDIINMLEEKYKQKIEGHQRLDNNVFIDFDEEFTWPSLENKTIKERGTCYALKDHIAILVDGTIVPCCLDTKGTINLGNIFKCNLDTVIKSDRYQTMLNGFKENKKCEELCQKCNFIK